MSRFLSEQETRELRAACRDCGGRIFVYLPEEKREEKNALNRTRVLVDCPEGHAVLIGLR